MFQTVKEEQVCRDEYQWKDCFAPEVKCFLPAGQIPLEATTGCGLLPHLRRLWKSIRSDDPARTYSDIRPQYLPGATADIVLDPISNKTPPLTVCFVFNKSAGQYPHIPVAPRMGIYHSTIDQIWHTSSCAGNSWGGYTHTVDLLTWYTGQSKIKYVPWDISHLSWNCHKLIFTTRTSRNWKRGVDHVSKAVASRSHFKHTQILEVKTPKFYPFSDWASILNLWIGWDDLEAKVRPRQ